MSGRCYFLTQVRPQRAQDSKGHPRTLEQGSDLCLRDPPGPYPVPSGPRLQGYRASCFLDRRHTPTPRSGDTCSFQRQTHDTAVGRAPFLSQPISQLGLPGSSL